MIILKIGFWIRRKLRLIYNSPAKAEGRLEWRSVPLPSSFHLNHRPPRFFLIRLLHRHPLPLLEGTSCDHLNFLTHFSKFSLETTSFLHLSVPKSCSVRLPKKPISAEAWDFGRFLRTLSFFNVPPSPSPSKFSESLITQRSGPSRSRKKD
uniref:Uncharacterized protein n=1 Tax=Cucumis melo TaxID=3656 RepID=A0A9I9EMC8_CUCME